MKLSGKLIIFSACLCIVSATLLASAWLKLTKDNTSPESGVVRAGETDFETLKAEKNISKSVNDNSHEVTYVLKLEDGKICAFIFGENETKILWNSMYPSPTLSDEEKAGLEKGIYTTSFEELCFFFESYAS